MVFCVNFLLYLTALSHKASSLSL